MIPMFKNLSTRTQGILYMIFGGILLLHTMGAFQQLFALVLGIAGIALIIYGFMTMDGPREVKKLIARFTSNKRT